MQVIRLVITGRVQGVGYRAWTVRQAKRLGLRGWVRNRSDGTVEAVVGGLPGAVEEMKAACHQGPAAAKVETVQVLPCTEAAPSGFEQRPTL